MMTLEGQIWEITGHSGGTHHEHHNGSWCRIRDVLVVRLGAPETHVLQTLAREGLRLVLKTTARYAIHFGSLTW